MLSKLEYIISKLAEAGITSPRLEANMLSEKAKDAMQLESFVQQRLSGKPICKIIEQKDFYKYTFAVNEDVLSPRPDTEILVEKAIEIIKLKHASNILELGVGSGCIVLSILREFPNLTGAGVDISDKALAVAKINSESLGVSERIKFINDSWFNSDLEKNLGRKYDIIVSNPPYIPSADIENLDIEVKEYDPVLALDGGSDGLRDYRKIAKVCKNVLNDGGFILLEIGIYQAEDVVNIFENQGFSLVEVTKDLSGIDRCIILKK